MIDRTVATERIEMLRPCCWPDCPIFLRKIEGVEANRSEVPEARRIPDIDQAIDQRELVSVDGATGESFMGRAVISRLVAEKPECFAPCNDVGMVGKTARCKPTLDGAFGVPESRADRICRWTIANSGGDDNAADEARKLGKYFG